MVNFVLKYAMTHTNEMNCEMMVAQAAPAMPQPKPKMKTGSRIMLRPAPINCVTIEVRGCPLERIK